MYFVKQNYPQLNRHHQLQVNASFLLPRRLRRYARDDVTMVDECIQSTATSSTHVKKNFQVNTFHDGLKARMDLCRYRVCPGSYLKCAFPIYIKRNMTVQSGIPVAILTPSNLHNYPWVVLLYSIRVLRWLLKSLNLITAPCSVRDEPDSVTWLATSGISKIHGVSWRNHMEKLTTLGAYYM